MSCTSIVILFAAATVMGGEHEDRHHLAIDAIKGLGGEVRVDSDEPGAPVTVTLTGSGNTDKCLPHLIDIRNLRTCDL